MREIRLSIPARPDYVHVLRTVAAGAAAMLEFSFDDIEDLRLAVDEAAAYLLGVTAATAVLRMRIASDENELQILTSVDGPAGAGPTGTQASIMWHILGALTDEARFEESEDGPAIRLMKRLPA